MSSVCALQPLATASHALAKRRCRHLYSSSLRRLFFFFSETHWGSVLLLVTLYTWTQQQFRKKEGQQVIACVAAGIRKIVTFTPSGAETFIDILTRWLGTL